MEFDANFTDFIYQLLVTLCPNERFNVPQIRGV